MEKTENVHPAVDWLPQVVIRTLRQSDLPALEWDGEYAHFRNVYATAYERMVKGSAVLWVATLPDDAIIGQVFIQLICDHPELADGVERAYLYSFRIRPPWRNAGLGSRMLATLEYDLRRRGFRALTLNVAQSNVDAQRLYLRKGFRIIGTDAGIWSYIDHNGDLQRIEEPAFRMLKKF